MSNFLFFTFRDVNESNQNLRLECNLSKNGLNFFIRPELSRSFAWPKNLDLSSSLIELSQAEPALFLFFNKKLPCSYIATCKKQHQLLQLVDSCVAGCSFIFLLFFKGRLITDRKWLATWASLCDSSSHTS